MDINYILRLRIRAADLIMTVYLAVLLIVNQCHLLGMDSLYAIKTYLEEATI